MAKRPTMEDAMFVRSVLDEVRDGCRVVLMVTPKMRRAIEASLDDEELDMVEFRCVPSPSTETAGPKEEP
jgi:hypothetical protein